MAAREVAAEDLPGLLHASSLLPPAGMLDVACGSGFLTPHLGSEMTGLHQSEAVLEVARGRPQGVGFLRGDALQTPLTYRSFDRASSSF